jgi:hypothetical protein
MEGTSTVLSIWKEKCHHSPEIQTFKTLSLSTSFEKLERNIYKKSLPTDPNFEDEERAGIFVIMSVRAFRN